MKCNSKVHMLGNPIGVLDERMKRVVELRSKGKTYREIGLEFNVSGGYAQNLYKHALFELRAAEESVYAGLSCRSANCLSNAGLTTKDKIRAALGQMKFRHNTIQFNGRTMYSFGWKSYVEVCKWIGFPEPRRPKMIKLCPHCGKEM